jgi:hypothetical protein
MKKYTLRERLLIMDGINTESAAVLALLADTSRAGRGGGGNFLGGGGEGGGYGMMFPGNSVLAAGAHADGTATKEAIDCHASANAAGIENLLDQNQFTATNKSIVDGHNRLGDNMSANVGRIADQVTNQEFRNGDRLRDLDKTIAANAAIAAKDSCETQKSIAEAAKEAAACCCAAQLAACKAHAELMASVIKENSETRALMSSTALDSANARIIQLETIDALRRHHG